MIEKGKVDIVAATQENFFTEEETFGADQGLQFAIAFTSELPPEVGTFAFSASEWGLDENGNFNYNEIPIESHTCSREELHLTEDTSNAKLFKPHSNNSQILSDYQENFLCIDNENLTINGDFDSTNGRTFNIYLWRCTGEECASDEELRSFLSHGYLLFASNLIRFDSNKYGDEAIIKESRISWIKVSSRVQLDYPFKVQ